MQQNKQYYDEFFTNYPVDVHDSPARFSAVTKLLKGKVLDVACGTGTLTKYYKGDYSGVDFSEMAIRKARDVRRKNAIYYVIDFTRKWEFKGEKFDSVYLGEFLEHIEDDKQVFLNVLSSIKPNGRIVVSVPNGDSVPDDSHCRTFTVPQIRKEYSKYGKITFHNWSGFSKRILFSIDIAKKSKNDITLVMIVKNEEKGIEKAILSALPIVDHVIVSVDTKTTDKTANVAKLYADELKFHDWQNDFSKARNDAQSTVQTKWILFLDGHEYIESYGDFDEKIKMDIEGIFITIRMESGLTFLYPRIFRSHLKFKNKVHNLIPCKTRRCSPEFVIVHDREGGQDPASADTRNKQREKMMPEELANQIKENPKNARAYFHLANFYMMRHKTDLAMKNYRKAIKYGKSNDQIYLCLLHLGALHYTKNQYLRALWKFHKAGELIPGRWETARVIGGFYYDQKNFKKALPYLVEALAENSRRYSYEPIKRNLVELWDMIANCFAQTDENEKALTAWKRAQTLSKEKSRKKLFQQKIDLVKTLVAGGG